jgi:hypothetical protein
VGACRACPEVSLSRAVSRGVGVGRETVTRSRPAHRAPIIPLCFASAPRQTIMLPGGSPPGIAPAASGRRGNKHRSRVGKPYPASGVYSPPNMAQRAKIPLARHLAELPGHLRRARKPKAARA